MNLELIRLRLQDRRIDKVCKATGLSRVTVSDIRDGKQANPTLETMNKLIKYLEARP